MKLLRSVGFWGALATVVFIGGIGWDMASANYWRGVGVTAFIGMFWWGVDTMRNNIYRRVLERENEELRAELRKVQLISK